MSAFLGYTPSRWVSLCHQIPRVDFGLEVRASTFRPADWEYQQTLLLLSSLSGFGLLLSFLIIVSYLIRHCCCRRRKGDPDGDSDDSDDEDDDDMPGGRGHKRARQLCCVTWGTVGAVIICCAAIGIGFYGNSEANDGLYQVTYSFATANQTLSSIDLLISDTVVLLKRAVSDPLTRLEEAFTPANNFIAVVRSTRRQSETVISLLSELPLDVSLGSQLAARLNNTLDGLSETGAVGRVAEKLVFIEDYRWLTFILLLLLDLLVCLFILLGLAKQARWLLIVMTIFAWVSLILSWGSLGLESAAAVALSDFCVDPDSFILNATQISLGSSPGALEYYLTCNQDPSGPFQQSLTHCQRLLSNIHSQLDGLERAALAEFPLAEKSLYDVQRILNTTEGNFHQLVALLNCRGLNKDYTDALKGLCYDGMEGVLYLCLFSVLSALSFTAMLCTLPPAWRHIHKNSRDYEESEDSSEDPFGSHQARRQTAVSRAGPGEVLPGFYNYPRGCSAPPLSTAPPLSHYTTPNASFSGARPYESLPFLDGQSPPPSAPLYFA
ncbi:protein tweety homolog 1 isoform X1 [Erpetoichthys calabaricus]|uniref:Protein tweety homolog n=1 Tax=Erpetoichthys calabaricus TaxID=27687 RepID=A0A8C4TLL5_ERPCA|nr:protein tweety homolog 1 isoform X1 [Erpetoichthys calabaricus]